MYLSIGNDMAVRDRSIIGIFDMDTTTVCVTSRKFLSQKEKEGCVESDGELPKSFLLCEKREKGISDKGKRGKRATNEKKEYSVFLSRLSSSVLFARTAGMKKALTEEEER